jgi:hypothetical protein
MATFVLPPVWDATKFAARYSLDMNKDFYVLGDSLVVGPTLPDNPPIFDLPDSPESYIHDDSVVLADKFDPPNTLIRSVLFVAIDELNLHALKINSILDAVDASTSLADLKTRIALIADYPARTPTQARNAIKFKISTGGAD